MNLGNNNIQQDIATRIGQALKPYPQASTSTAMQLMPKQRGYHNVEKQLNRIRRGR